MQGEKPRSTVRGSEFCRIVKVLPLLLGGLSVVVACTNRPAASVGSVRDSSGVRLVELPGVDAIKREWKLEGAPAFRLGWAQRDPQLQNVVSGRFLDSGRIVIADNGAKTIYILESNGVVAAALGGKGKGPGEFQTIIGVTPLQADSFLVTDYTNDRATLYDGEHWVSDERLAIRPGYVYDTGSSSPEDRFLTFPWAGIFPKPGWGKAPVMRVDETFSTADTVMERDVLLVTRRYDHNPVRQMGWLQYGGGMVITARTDRAQVEWRSPNGVLNQVSRWDHRARDLNGNDWSRYADALRKRHENEARSELEGALAAQKVDFGGSYPALQRIYAAHGGNVWIAQFDLTTRSRRSGRYWILSREAGWLGYIDLPPSSEVLDITGDRLLLLESDSLDVEAVAMYRVAP